MDTLTDADGRFTFNHFPRIDTPVFVLKAVNKRGRSGNTSISMDETLPPMFDLSKVPVQSPWYLNMDSVRINNLHSTAIYRDQQDNPTGSHVLKEVTIKAKRTVNGSQNINGPGNADVVLDEKFMEQQGKKNWFQLLESNVKSFNATSRTEFFQGQAFTYSWYFVDGKPVTFVIDGIRLTDALPSYSFISIKDYLQSHDAQDIKGIEVMYSGKYSVRYASRYHLWPFFQFAFIEITTRAGRGPIISNTAGMYLYKPLAISWPRQFYKPKYEVRDTTRLVDLRSTIDWEPNIITDNNGAASITFYAGSAPSNYTAIMEGTDLKGNVGYIRKKIIIAGKDNTKSK
jgi:hypothetical protein